MKYRRRVWTDAEVDLLRALYPNTQTQELADRFDRPISTVYHKARMLGLTKSPEFNAGRLTAGHQPNRTSFAPGHVPWSKGKTGIVKGRTIETQFKPGHRPTQWVPIGTVVVSGDGYLKRKIRDDAPAGMSRLNWKFVHIEVWEEHNGPMPRGHLVAFINGDKRDIRIENLELVSRREWIKRHTVHNLPKELVSVIQLKGAVQRQINRREKA